MGKNRTLPHLVPIELHVKLPRDLGLRLAIYISNHKQLTKTEVVCKAINEYLSKYAEI